ncbi:hypothetical protein C9374_006368 [Naegleria lovaniensis]|uniref:Phosphatidate cytidylyltransferase n=1 Tax=Naegleria lovaniensis TaxID=51637 RepID=A0AA88KH49_NAELO|nr:uncharacterized protein C9374_006368 [Naegleria lovaniensis]KAG2381379.1 hypothetical protein C9374_006368 [Naegleria lovaniensis]
MGVLNLVQRFIVAFIAIPTVMYCIKYHSLLTIITTTLSIVGIYELHGISNRITNLLLPMNGSSASTSTNTLNTSTTSNSTNVLLTLFLTYIGYFHSNSGTSNLNTIDFTQHLSCAMIFIFFFIFVLDMIVFSPYGLSDEHHTRTFLKIFMRTFSVFYIGLGFSSALYLVQQYRFLLVLILFCNWASDAMALLFGKKLGHYKLHRYLSPNKTIEGGIGAILGSTLTAYLLYLVNERVLDLNEFFREEYNDSTTTITTTTLNHHYILPFHLYIVYGIILGVLGIIGDLIESYLKRIAKVKDSGSFFGAHGGVLDRVDGLLFSFPIMVMIHMYMV